MKQLRLRLGTNGSVDEASLNAAFESHVHGVLSKLDRRLPLLNNDNTKRVEIVMAKHGLCDGTTLKNKINRLFFIINKSHFLATFQQTILLCQTISPALGDVLKRVRSIHAALFTELQQTSGELKCSKVSYCI